MSAEGYKRNFEGGIGFELMEDHRVHLKNTARKQWNKLCLVQRLQGNNFNFP